jgi:hypothetical protein
MNGNYLKGLVVKTLILLIALVVMLVGLPILAVYNIALHLLTVVLPATKELPAKMKQVIPRECHNYDYNVFCGC